MGLMQSLSASIYLIEAPLLKHPMPAPDEAGEVAAQLSPVVADDDAHIPPGDTQSDLCLPQVRLVEGNCCAGGKKPCTHCHAKHLEGSVALCLLGIPFGGSAGIAWL